MLATVQKIAQKNLCKIGRLALFVLLLVVVSSSLLVARCHPGETNTLEDTVVLAINIQYGWKSRHLLDDITTEEFRLTLDDRHFFRGLQFYWFTEEGFSHRVHQIDESTFKVRVPLENMWFSYWQVITVIRTPDGRYLIDEIEFDS